MTNNEAHIQTISVKNLPSEGFKELDEFISTTSKNEYVLIRVLHKAQKIFGYLPQEVQLHIARKLNLSGAKVFGVVSFYSYFTQKPVGKNVISICTGTACFVRGSEKVFDKFKEILEIENGETTEDKLFTIKDVRCIGACGLAPVVIVGEKVFGHVKPENVKDIIDKYREEASDEN